MKSNLHTHTVRCRHAVDADEEYVKAAVAAGYDRLGFSDHSPFIFPDGSQSGFRMLTESVEDYVSSLSELRKKYKDRIEIYIGLEMEYYPKFYDQMISNARKWGIEYLLLGEHFLGSEYPEKRPSTAMHDDPKDLKEYVDCCIAAMDTGCFTYIAHPDIFGYNFESEEYEEEMGRMIKHAVQTDTPLEINLLGMMTNRHYPNPNFWRIAGKIEGVKAVIGSDAHASCEVYIPEGVKRAKKLAADNNVEIIDKPAIRFLK